MNARQEQRLREMLNAYAEDVFTAATHHDISARVDSGAIGAIQVEAIVKYVADLAARSERVGVYARVVHELIWPDNGKCNQCGGHWLYRGPGEWDYLDGDHLPNCVLRRLASEVSA